MKRLLAIFGTGFVVGLIVAPESGRQLRRRVRLLFRRGSRTRPYVWSNPEERLAGAQLEIREKMLDKTLADSFPASDPPSSIPNPSDGSLVA